VKIVDPLVYRKWSSNKSVSIVVNIFKILIFYDLMLRVVIETGVFWCFVHWTHSEVLLVPAQEYPDDGTSGVSKHVEGNTASIVFTL